MIFAIKTFRDSVVDDFVERFRNPPSLSMKLLHSSVYVENRVDWVDDLLVFRQRSIVDGFAKFGIVSSLALMLIAVFFQSSPLLWTGLLLAIVCMAVLSPVVRFCAIVLKLAVMGHWKKTILVSNTLLLEKLFVKLEGG